MTTRAQRMFGWTCMAAALAAVISTPAWAQRAYQGDEFLRAISVLDERAKAQAEAEPIGDLLAVVDPDLRERWDAFQLDLGGAAGGGWLGYVDKRTGRVDFAEGGGIAWVPGLGNQLTAGDIAVHLGGRRQVDLAVLESIARAFLPRVAPLLGVDPAALVLNPGRSGHPADYLWFVDFDVVRAGVPIDGARVVFRINHGNLIQFGSENLPAPGTPTPGVALSKQQALAVLSDYVGGVTPWDDFADPGSLRLVPVAVADGRFADGFAFGRGRGLAAVWEFTFRRPGEVGTWRGRVDATSGELVDFADVNDYGQATGGVYLTLPTAGETVKPMPWADVTASTYANSAGYFSSGSSSTLNGQYVRIVDTCGAISRATDGSGNIPFGSSTTGTDCSTPGVGGSGNTHSSRSGFYHLNRTKEVGRGWLPTNTWLTAKLTANVNLNQTCNAYWSPSAGTVNFFKSGGGCKNSGELAGVLLHEYGHGLDQNDGNGSSSDSGTRESYGDLTAALGLRNSCIGGGFFTNNDCGNSLGYPFSLGDPCTGCSGIRDIDWAKHASGTAHTVHNFTRLYCTDAGTGPCMRQGHCESHISSEAVWDLGYRDLPNPNTNAAWLVVDRLWYFSRPTASRAFNCTTGATWTANGCFTGSWWRTLRSVDDDDGNLANGTPHGGALYAAFNRHGIACTTDSAASTTFVAVSPPATPTLTLANGSTNQVVVSWTSSGGGIVYDVYRNEVGCGSGFAKVANDRTGTSYTDTAVVNGMTYYYQLVAHPSGNEAASAAPTLCKSIIPSGTTPFVVTASVPGFITVKTTYQLTGSANAPATNWKWERSDDNGATYYLWANAQNSQFIAYAGQYTIYWRLSATRVSDGAGDSDVRTTIVCIPSSPSCELPFQGGGGGASTAGADAGDGGGGDR